MLLDNKLPPKAIADIVNDLFGFTYETHSNEHYILYDDEGDEFYDLNLNIDYDFTTMRGIILYATAMAKEKGKEIAQNNIQKALGLK